MSLVPDNDATIHKAGLGYYPIIALLLGSLAILFLVWFWFLRAPVQPPCPPGFHEAAISKVRQATLLGPFLQVTTKAGQTYLTSNEVISFSEIYNRMKAKKSICIKPFESAPSKATIIPAR